MSGNIDTRTEVIPAAGVVQLSNANFMFILSSTGSTTIKMIRSGLQRGANQESYVGQLGGLQVGRTQRWDMATISGTPGVSITFIYGYTDIREDFTYFNQQITTITGTVLTSDSPSGTFVSGQTAPATGGANTVPANLVRRRITFNSPTTNTGSVFLQKTGDGSGKGLELVPGEKQLWVQTQAIDVRNDSGATQTINWIEET